MKSAFITGASQGLGYGFVQHLLNEGWHVFGGVRKIDAGLPTHKQLTWVELDVTDDVSIARAVSSLQEKGTTLDVLVNNAGLNKDTATDNHKEKVCTLGTLDRTLLQDMFDVNAISPIMVLQGFLPLLTPTPAFVINVSSCRASFHDEYENEYGNYGYRASKIALNMLTFSSVKDLPKNIRTFAVHPGSVKSHMNPSGEGDPALQAGSIISILDRWDPSHNGQFLRYDGSLYPL